VQLLIADLSVSNLNAIISKYGLKAKGANQTKGSKLTERYISLKRQAGQGFLVEVEGKRKQGLQAKPSNTEFMQTAEIAELVIEQVVKAEPVVEKVIETVIENVAQQQPQPVQEQLERIRNLCANSERQVGEQVDLQEGFVYIAVNEIYGGWCKVGMTLDYEARISTYNTSCPFDGFKMLVVAHAHNRRAKEAEMLAVFKKQSSSSKGEWFEIEEGKAKALFTSLASSTGNVL